MSIETKQDLRQSVLEQLGKGKREALPGRVLAQRLGERDTRRIRLTIIELLKDNHPILGDAAHGYYIADSLEDCVILLNRLRKTGKMLFLHYKYLKLAAHKNFSGQFEMRF